MNFKRSLVLKVLAKKYVKYLLADILFRHVSSGLQPERLYLYLKSLYETREIEGAVVEVGCDVCGTSIIANRMLKNLGIDKAYVGIDTFGGFVEDQFISDTKRGTSPLKRSVYSYKSLKLVKKILRIHHSEDIILIKGDIVELPISQLPDIISVCLLDVDLELPIYEALKKIYPLMTEGGIIIVDDCPKDSSWKGARVGFEKFCSENNLISEYEFGAGVIYKLS